MKIKIHPKKLSPKKFLSPKLKTTTILKSPEKSPKIIKKEVITPKAIESKISHQSLATQDDQKAAKNPMELFFMKVLTFMHSTLV